MTRTSKIWKKPKKKHTMPKKHMWLCSSNEDIKNEKEDPSSPSDLLLDLLGPFEELFLVPSTRLEKNRIYLHNSRVF